MYNDGDRQSPAAHHQQPPMSQRPIHRLWTRIAQGRPPTFFNILYITLRAVFALAALALLLTLVATFIQIKSA
jgi:hypothetical protein